MADQREENVYMAKLAEQAERYDGMFRSERYISMLSYSFANILSNRNG
jgi:hypothetical protein